MPRIQRPLPFPDLKAKPELSPLVNLTDDMSQVLALLSGYDGTQRRLLRCSPTGVLHTLAPRTRGAVNVLADTDDYNWQGSNLDTTEVMIRSNPANIGLVWVNIDVIASDDSGWVLSSGEVLNLTLNNLNNIHLNIKSIGEKVIILYSQ